jgi:hypothetical protein
VILSGAEYQDSCLEYVVKHALYVEAIELYEEEKDMLKVRYLSMPSVETIFNLGLGVESV